MEPEEKKSNGALLGSIIIIIIIIVGGIYIWQSKVKNALKVTPVDTSELDALEQDLGTIDTNVDVDVNSIN